MKVCAICGKTDKETRIIHSIKYGMNLCKYHQEQFSRKHILAQNNIVDNKLIIDNKEFIFNKDDLPIIEYYKWQIRYIDNIPYVVTSNGHFLLNMLCKHSDNYKIIFKDNNYYNYQRDNLLLIKKHSFKKIKFNRCGYKGIYQSSWHPNKYRYEAVINNRRISTKEFPRMELVVYLAYLVGKVLFNDKTLDDKITKEYLKKLNIVDKENIERYFKEKFLILDKSFQKLWIEYCKDKRFKDKIENSIKNKFNNDL